MTGQQLDWLKISWYKVVDNQILTQQAGSICEKKLPNSYTVQSCET